MKTAHSRSATPNHTGELRGADGRLRRSWKAGDVRHKGYLEDYANLVEGLLTLDQTTFDARWFVAARGPADTMPEHFADRGRFL